MAKEPPSKATESQPTSSLGLENFSMGAVRATETQEASEISRRWFRTLLGLALFALVVAAGIWWFTTGKDRLFRPGPEDAQFLLSLRELDAARAGIISDFKFAGVNALNFQIPPGFSLNSKENQFILRQAIVELVAAFSDYRMGQAVRVSGFQQSTLVAEGRRLLKSGWSDRKLLEALRAGEKKLPVWVNLPGEKAGPEGSQNVE
jgi:hypothetical protein